MVYYFIVTKNSFWILPTIISSIICILVFFTFLFLNKIDFALFFTQYFAFPRTIGAERINDLNLDLKRLIFHFKFVHLASLPIFYFILKGVIKNKVFLRSNEFFSSLIFLFFTFSLIFHQLITKNQTYIFFLIPLLLAFSHTIFNSKKYNVFFVYFLVFLCLFVSTKYHLRFNEGRKFMELANVNLNLAKKGIHIDKKLKGLKWITPYYPDKVQEEISLIQNTIIHLKKVKENTMVITDYQFFSSILEKDLMSPNRWYTTDGVSYPLKNNKYFSDYKKYFVNLVSSKKINLIYTVIPIEVDAINIIFEENCLETIQINHILYKHKLHECY